MYRSLRACRCIAVLAACWWLPAGVRGEVPQTDGEVPASQTVSGKKDPASPQSNSRSAPVYPAFQNIRSEEDWSVLRGSPRDRTYEHVKFIPLNGAETVFLSVGGQIRLRAEGWRNFGFGGPGVRDDTFGLSRLRLHTDLWFGSRARVFVEAKSALAAGRRLPGGFRTLDVDSIELQNAHVDVRWGNEERFRLRIGRQEIQFGKQRLISPLDWSNTRRSFDGVRVTGKAGEWQIDGFWTKYDAIHKYSFNRPGRGGLDLFGLHATGSAQPVGKIDLYWLGTERDAAVWSGKTADDRRQTLGGRVWGKVESGWDWEVEAAYQLGSHGPRDIRAWMATGEVGYGLSASRFKPHLLVGVDYASGDGDRNDGKVETFDQILPLGHAYLGHADFVGRQNILDWRQEMRVVLRRSWAVTAASHLLWLANSSDALYNAGGAVVRAGAPGARKRVGWEVDLTGGHSFNRYLRVDGGYSHFLAGPAIRATGPSESIDFFYFSVQTTF